MIFVPTYEFSSGQNAADILCVDPNESENDVASVGEGQVLPIERLCFEIGHTEVHSRSVHVRQPRNSDCKRR